MARGMAPEASLGARFPSVAETWHPVLNGDRTPWNTSAKNSYRAWWRCPEGHEWQEIVATRTSTPAWKRRDPAACRVCVGHHVIVTFTCGHTCEVPAPSARPDRDCPTCRREAWRQRDQQYRQQRAANSAAAKQLYADCADRAQALVQQLEPEGDPPAPLVVEWRRLALHDVRGAIVSEELFGKSGAIETALVHHRRLAGRLVPTAQDLRLAVERREPLRLLDRSHWAPGWLHYLGAGGAPAVRVAPEVASLDSTLSTGAEELLDYFGDRQLRVEDVTRILTDLIVGWAQSQETKWRDRRWKTFRELSLPITPAGSTRFGRVDLTVMRPDAPDLVVEIDSAHNDRSVEKLTFAHEAGGVPVWVRWRGGRVEAPEGVHLIDLVAATRRLTLPG